MHRCDLARTMTFLAAVLQDGKHVFVKLCAGDRWKTSGQANEPAKQRTYRGIAWSKNRRSPLLRSHGWKWRPRCKCRRPDLSSARHSTERYSPDAARFADEAGDSAPLPSPEEGSQ